MKKSPSYIQTGCPDDQYREIAGFSHYIKNSGEKLDGTPFESFGERHCLRIKWFYTVVEDGIEKIYCFAIPFETVTYLDRSRKYVDVAKTIEVNGLPLPGYEELKEALDAALERFYEESDGSHWYWTQEATFHQHSQRLEGKFGYVNQDGRSPEMGDAIWFCPYYSYSWSNPREYSGAGNYPVLMG